MDIENTKNTVPKIDVEKVLYSKNPGLRKVMPKFIVNYLKKIVHQDDLNFFLEKSGHLKDGELIEAGLKFLGINARIYGTENIPSEGRYIFVSNHPLGGLDGIVFIHELSKIFNICEDVIDRKFNIPVNL